MSQATSKLSDENDELQVLVSSSTGRLRGPKICHEIGDDGQPRCNSAGKFRKVSPLVYPHRKQCEKDACWAESIPEEMQGHK